MSRPKIRTVVVAGARPNFMKVAPLLRALKKNGCFETTLVHTGQHYDFKMSEVFFKDLGIPRPGVYLNVGSGSHAEQTGRILTAFEGTLLKIKPRLVVVVGDVNSAAACALAAVKLGIRVAHVEAGLRSFDRRMPEEINRIVTDRLSDTLFVSEESGLKNLKNEGVAQSKIFHVGNIMIDSLIASLPAIKRSPILRELGLRPVNYAVVTLHRPSNVDTAEALKKVQLILKDVCRQTTAVFPIHPRTQGRIIALGLDASFKKLKGLKLVSPMGYTDFLGLVRHASLVLTDSGGIQEETTFLKIPCMTLRENTERPATLDPGSNVLVGLEGLKIGLGLRRALSGRWKRSGIPRYWDGKTASRIARVLSRVKN